MLGWFKKKIKKEKRPEETLQEVESPLEESPLTTESPEPSDPVQDEPALDADLFTYVPPQVVEEDPAPVAAYEEVSDEPLLDEESTEPVVTEQQDDPVVEEQVLSDQPIPPEQEPPLEQKHVIIEPAQEEETDASETKNNLLTEEVAEEAKPEVEEIPEDIDQETDEDVISEPVPPVEQAEQAEQEIEAVSSPPATQPVNGQEKKKKSLFSRLADRLSRTRESFTYQLDTIFLGKKEIDAELLDDLEELLITADLGVATTQEILDHARRKVKRNELSDPNSLKIAIQEKIKSFIEDHQEDAELVMPDEGPFVIMVVGVNGVGKTTTIGKVANKFVQSGQSVLLVAADTFRAAAISQLKIWGERVNVPVHAQDEGSDPSSVVFDAIAHARAKQYDVVIVDTAGRLHTQANLMEELKKVKRVMGKKLEGAPHEIMLIVDATTGQNGISQAKLFNEAVGVTGIALTKLDGTAKGGIVANICRELQTPIRFIGIGEQMDDLRDFDTDEFIEALFQTKTSGASE